MDNEIELMVGNKKIYYNPYSPEEYFRHISHIRNSVCGYKKII